MFYNFHRKGRNPFFFYTLSDHILQYVGTNPYLGVTLSEDLTFDAHVGNITKKGSRMLSCIQRNLKSFPSRLKELAYLTLVRSGLEYASVVWDPLMQREIDRLKNIQRRAARFVTNNYWRECGLTSTQLIESLGWDSLQERRKTARLCMLYKAINREVALSIDILCRTNSRTRGSTQNFKTIKTKKIPFSNSFFIRTIPDWNKLPSDVKLAPTFTAFKARLEKSE